MIGTVSLNVENIYCIKDEREREKEREREREGERGRVGEGE